MSWMPSTSYSLLSPASNSKSSYVSFTCPFFLISCSSTDTWKTSWIFHFWAIQTYKFVCLPGVIFEKYQETWLPTCNFAWFWGICYLARPCCLRRSFVAWLLYCGLTSKALVRSGGSVGKRSSTFGAWRIVSLRFLIWSRDQKSLLPCRKHKNDIHSWAWKACSWC